MVRLVLGLVICCGCYSPQPQPGSPCPDGQCPTGLACSPATQTCELHAVDGAVADVPGPIDSGPDVPPNVPSLLQQNTNYAATAATLSVTLPTMPTSGDVLVMIGATPSGSLTSVTGAGVTWMLATRSTTNANIEMWYGVTDGSSATITIDRATNTSPMWLAVSEWSGLADTNVLVDAASSSGITSPASAGSIATTGPALIMFAASNGGSNTFGSPTPGTWTVMTGIMGADMQSEWYQVATTAGMFAPEVSETAHVWDAAIAAFRYTP